MLKAVDKIISKVNHNFEFIDLGGGMGIDYSHKNTKLNLIKYSQSIQHKYSQSIQQKYKGFNTNTKYSTQLKAVCNQISYRTCCPLC